MDPDSFRRIREEYLMQTSGPPCACGRQQRSVALARESAVGEVAGLKSFPLRPTRGTPAGGAMVGIISLRVLVELANA
jgi:hypothetical protein